MKLKSKDDIIKQQEELIKKLQSQPNTQDQCLQAQIAEPQLTNRRAKILVENEHLRRQVVKMEKKLEHHKNKENKFLYFLFHLQN